MPPPPVVVGARKNGWSALKNVLAEPKLMNAYLNQMRTIREQKGLKGLMSEIKSRF